MKLNAKKCKKLRVCFFRDTPVLEPLTIDGILKDVVDCHKVLGTVLNSSLKWTDHVNMITKKAAKRLHIIRTLKRSGMTADDLLTIYIAFIRSVLEYCCPVWHTNPPSYLSEQIERSVQKRVLRIICPQVYHTERHCLLQIVYGWMISLGPVYEFVCDSFTRGNLNCFRVK